jgi:hypothetical protein
MLVAFVGCRGEVGPYDQDLAYCRRAAAPPISSSHAELGFFVSGSASQRTQQEELMSGSSQRRFAACMRARFEERFPGEPYPLRH